MQHFSMLLEIDDSQLAWVLRLSLYGIRTQLQEAIKTTVKTDSGIDACKKLLQELDRLLEISSRQESTANIPSWDDVLEPVPAHAPIAITSNSTISELKLRHIGEILLSDRELSSYIGIDQFNSTNDADLWNEMQLLLLRVPQDTANIWRERILKRASELGATEDKRSIRKLPFIRTEDIYSGLSGCVKTSGLRLSNQANFEQRLMLKETQSKELNFLAGVVSTCLKLIELDSSLHHALKSVDRFAVRSLNSESERANYVEELIERFHRVHATVDADPAIALRARLDLDEAIHSLIYYPPADRYSWWGKMQQEVRHTLDQGIEKARQAGYQVQIRSLWGIYADVYTYSKDDLQLKTGGIPGEVSACLRVYAKINDEVLLGRVIFRSF